MSERMIRLLADLPRADPDPARAERTRERCRTRVAGLPGESTLTSRRRRGRSVHLWQPLIASLAIAYLADAIVEALRAYGIG